MIQRLHGGTTAGRYKHLSILTEGPLIFFLFSEWKPSPGYAILPASIIQILPQQYAIAGTLPMQTIMPNLQPNIYNYNPVVASVDPIIVQNIASFNVPASTVTVLNSNVNHPISAVPKIYLPMAGTVSSKESSYLHVTQLDDNNSKQNDRIEKFNSRDNGSNPACNEMPDDWCQMEKMRVAKMCETTQWTGETVYDDIRPPRKMGPKCSSEFCKNSSTRHCYEFSEKLREEIFNFFWQQLNWNERKIYVCDLIKLYAPKQNCTAAAHTVSSLNYFLRANGTAKSVCKKMFINSIGIGENTLRQWMGHVQRKESVPVKIVGDVVSKETNKATVARTPECVFESKQQQSPDYWIRDKVKRARERGEAYYGYCNKNVDAKSGRRSFGRALREQRSLGPPCTSSFCERSKKRQCSRFTETIRQHIFDRFWKTLGWDERKTFIVESVDIMQPKRRTCIDVESSRRGVTCSYFLCIGGQRHNICRQLFLNTLGLKEATVQYWLMQNTTEHDKRKEGAEMEPADRNGAMRLYKSKRIRLPDHQK